jgi:hypothetical protein
VTHRTTAEKENERGHSDQQGRNAGWARMLGQKPWQRQGEETREHAREHRTEQRGNAHPDQCRHGKEVGRRKVRHPALGDHERVGDQPGLRGVGHRPGKESVREIARVDRGRDLVDVRKKSSIKKTAGE